MPPTPQKYTKCKNIKNIKHENRQKLIILEVQPKRIAQLSSAYFFTYYSTGQHWFSTIFQKWHFFDIRIINNCVFLMFWRLGTMLERFFIGKSFRLHISKPKKIPGNIFFDISKVQKSSRRGLLSKIFDKLRIQGRMQIFGKSPRVL